MDPGLTTGYAWFDERGEVLTLGQMRGVAEFANWLESQPVPKLIICEDFRLDPNTPQGGSKMEASQVIGMVKSYSLRFGLVVIIQANRNLKPGYAFAGLKPLPKSRHAESHQYDAFAHGVYYLVKNNLRPHALAIRLAHKDGSTETRRHTLDWLRERGRLK